MNIRWDAEGYAENFSFVPDYGRDVLSLLEAAAGSAVLDLGCGNGTLTRALREKGYRAMGLDASEALLAIARRDHPDIPFVQGDATAFSLRERVDAVFSNAVFHWIDRERQRDMLACVREALKEGGELVFEMGGKGNNRRIHGALGEVFKRHGYRYEMPFYFPAICEYAALLEAAGFETRVALLFDRPTPLQGEAGLADWIRMFVKAPFEAVSEAEEREQMIAEAAQALRGELYARGVWYADYVRLRMRAVRL